MVILRLIFGLKRFSTQCNTDWQTAGQTFSSVKETPQIFRGMFAHLKRFAFQSSHVYLLKGFSRTRVSPTMDLRL